MQGYFKSLRFELNPFNVKVSMVEPVWFKTGLGAHAVAARQGSIADYSQYRQQADAATQKASTKPKRPMQWSGRLSV